MYPPWGRQSDAHVDPDVTVVMDDAGASAEQITVRRTVAVTNMTIFGFPIRKTSRFCFETITGFVASRYFSSSNPLELFKTVGRRKFLANIISLIEMCGSRE